MPDDAPPKVVLVEDHALFRRGLRRLLDESGFAVVGEASNGEAGVRLVAELRPDVVVMDLHMPIMGGVEATRRIVERPDAPAILILTISVEDEDVVQAMVAGASGYLLKDAEADVLVAAVREAARGRVSLSPAVAGALVDQVRAGARDETPAGGDLSERELEVLRLIVEGCDNAQIAARLYVSASTVKSHVSSILEKLGVESRVQAAVHAVRTGLV